jgi:iron complex transport system substrate-binding protein
MTTSELRIVSLLASSTEIVCALGLENNLVGISHECDYPLEVKKLPCCTKPKFNHHVSSLEIDQQVSALVRNGLSVYQVHTDILELLKPDFIVTQSQCEVCAVSFKDVESAVCQLISSRPQIVNLKPNDLNDVFTDIINTAIALNVPEKGEAILSRGRERMKIVRETVALAMEVKPVVATIEWIQPLMFAANWVPEMIEIAGGVNLFGTAGQHSHYFEWKALVEANPDVILVMCCGFDIPRTLEEMHLIVQQPNFATLKAVQNKRLYITDGNSYFNRPGPRIIDSIEIMAEIFYPSLFESKYRHTYQVFESQTEPVEAL